MTHSVEVPMDVELKARLLKYLDGLEAAAQKAGEFAEAEVPRTVQEYLTWLAITEFCSAFVWLVAVGLAVWVGRVLLGRAFAHMQKENWDKSEPPYVLAFAARYVAYALAVLFLFTSFHHVIQGVKPLVAPRVVLVEKAVELVKGDKKAN